MVAFVVAAGLVAYNNLLNRWPPFNGALYVPLNLACAAALVILAGAADVSWQALGLEPQAADLLGGGIAATVLTAPVFVAARHPATAGLVADERVRGLRGTALAYQVLIRIPLGTALLEEVAFRGVLPALFGGPSVSAALWSSVAFGLWHVAPTINLIEANRPATPSRTRMAVVLGTVVFTAAVGAFLVWLRWRTGSLSAGFALHACVNSLATLAAAAAHSGPSRGRRRGWRLREQRMRTADGESAQRTSSDDEGDES